MSEKQMSGLEREYSPSTCIADISYFIKQYINLSQENKNSALKNHSLLADLSYGDSTHELIDLYKPTQGNNKKLLVYIHGGYWQELSKDESSFAANYFQQQGCFFAAINYSLAPTVSLTEIVEQNRRAIGWLYSHAEQLDFDHKQIYLVGSSAGAHLAMMMLTTNWEHYLPDVHSARIIQGICAVSGIYDLAPIMDTYINDKLHLTHREAKLNSPIYYQEFQPSAIILAVAENETDTFKLQTQMMVEHLTKLGHKVNVQLISGRNHFDVILDIAISNTWLCQQLHQQMALAEFPA